MIRTTLRSHVAVLIAGAVLCASAEAALISVSVQFHTSVETSKGAMDVYRLYANFTEGDDRVVAWGGFPEQGYTTEFWTGPCDDPPFYEGFGLTTAPSQGMIDAIPILQWETFATIGVSIADQGIPYDQTSLSIGFPPFIQGNSLLMTDSLVWVPNQAPQGRADFGGGTNVLLAQLTVPDDEYVYGHIALRWMDSNSQIYTTQQSWIGLAAIGRCCLPSGECIVTYQSDCFQFLNGFYLGCNPCDACELTCLPDIAPHPGDGEVNTDDLIAVINSWGECPTFALCPADVAPSPRDHIVNVDDLIAVINGWGPCK